MFVTKKKHIEMMKNCEEISKKETSQKYMRCLFEEVLEVHDLMNENEELKTKVNILETFIKFEYNKEIDRLEKVKNRTSKFRIKKKCENRILDYKSRLLAFEK